MKHFLVTVRKDGIRSVMIVPAEKQSDIAKVLRDNGLSGSIRPITFPDPLREVVVTCGWGKTAHKWETSKWQAMHYRNVCPEHRA